MHTPLSQIHSPILQGDSTVPDKHWKNKQKRQFTLKRKNIFIPDDQCTDRLARKLFILVVCGCEYVACTSLLKSMCAYSKVQVNSNVFNETRIGVNVPRIATLVMIRNFFVTQTPQQSPFSNRLLKSVHFK